MFSGRLAAAREIQNNIILYLMSRTSIILHNRRVWHT